MAPSLTSREILTRLSLAEGVKSALGRIVAVVERIHFGGREASEADYRNCRVDYRSLAGSAGT